MHKSIRTQLRLQAELYEAVREYAYEMRQSRNRFMEEAKTDDEWEGLRLSPDFFGVLS
jgi:predicted transcriptional regulator